MNTHNKELNDRAPADVQVCELTPDELDRISGGFFTVNAGWVQYFHDCYWISSGKLEFIC